MSNENTPETTAKKMPRRKRRGPRYFGLWPFLKVLFFLLLLGFGAFVLSGKSVSTPEWVRAKVQEQLDIISPNGQITFGDIFLHFDREFRPNFTVTNLERRNTDGVLISRSEKVQASLSKSALLRGEFHPRQIELSGVEVSVRRAQNGVLDFGVDVEIEPTNQAIEKVSLSRVMQTIDKLFQIPEMAALETVNITSLTVAYEDLRVDRNWLISQGRFNLIHDKDRVEVNVGFDIRYGSDQAATTEFSFEKKIGELEALIGAKVDGIAARDLASQVPALAWLGVLEAPISGALRAEVGTDGFISRLNGTLEIGKGLLKPSETARSFGFNSGRAYFGFDAEHQKIEFNELSVKTEIGSLVLEGSGFLRNLEEGIPKTLLGQFRISELSANPDGVFAVPINMSGGAIDMKLDFDPFSLSIGQLVLEDDEYIYQADGEISVVPNGWQVSLNAKAPNIDPVRLLELWPVVAIPPTRTWLEQNVNSANIFNVIGALRLKPHEKPIYGLSFEIDDANVRFVKTLPPIQHGKGHAAITDNTFTLTVTQGVVTAPKGGRINAAGTVFQIPDINQIPAKAHVFLKAKGPITAALSLLDEKPFNIMSKAGQPVDLATGVAQIDAQIRLVLAKKIEIQDVDYNVDAILRNVSTDKIIKGRVLHADRLSVTATPTKIVIAGKGQIGTVPIQGAWRQALGPKSDGHSRVEGTIELSQRFVTEFGIGLPKGSVSGAGQARIEIDLARGAAPKFHLISDLNRIGLRIADLAWRMAKNSKGLLDVSGTLGDVPHIDNLVLEGAGLKAKGSVTLTSNGDLKSARFSRVRLAGWLDAAVELVGRGKNRTPNIVVSSGRVDIRKTSFGGAGGGGRSNSTLVLNLDSLIVSEGIVLSNFSGEFKRHPGFNGKFTARINGGARIRGTVTPTKGGSAVRILSKDAGGVYRSAGVLDRAHGGTLDMTLIPRKGENGVYDGSLAGKNIKIIGAPAMAGILGAISIVGLLEQLNGQGIVFNSYEGRFRLTPKQVIVTSASAIGASIGVSMDGIYNLQNSTLDMRGVISPIYILNGVGAILTRKGEGLIGFNYKMVGSADDPQIKVNPLSLLTPGMFRNLFRKRPPKLAP